MKKSIFAIAAISLFLSGGVMGEQYNVYVLPNRGIDASIPLQVRPPQFQSPFEMQMQFQQIQQQRQMMEMQELQMQQMREMQELQRQKRAMEIEIKARKQDKAQGDDTWAVVCALNPKLCEKGEEK